MLRDGWLGDGEGDLKQMCVQVVQFNFVGNHGLKNNGKMQDLSAKTKKR
jgi:hypothetical protein